MILAAMANVICRIGFKGETQIAEFTGYGRFNIRLESDSKPQRVWLWWFGQNGTFDYGRNSVSYNAEAWTDMLPEFGGDTCWR